ncbi:MAG: hypothetical protein KKA28_18765 [Planctomycetes bacterium]|nr:hypothetical protein [Planctomycetota bacterium]
MIKYHVTYPPLGLLKLSAYHKALGDEVKYVCGPDDCRYNPDVIYITSLYTYAFERVGEAITFYRNAYPKARLICGGIYASLCPGDIEDYWGDDVEVHRGVFPEAEDLMPDYDLLPADDDRMIKHGSTSQVFASRGCPEKCPYCFVRLLEPEFEEKRSVKHLVEENHKKVVFWDNNFFANAHWKDVLGEVAEMPNIKEIDFSQGLDCRRVNEGDVEFLRKSKVKTIRLAYDQGKVFRPLKRTVGLIKDAGINPSRVMVYVLYNFRDTPESFWARINTLIEWGVAAFPMRYQHKTAEPKNNFVSRNWDIDQLQTVEKFKRVLHGAIHSRGSIPSCELTRRKLLDAATFEEAFRPWGPDELREIMNKPRPTSIARAA